MMHRLRFLALLTTLAACARTARAEQAVTETESIYDWANGQWTVPINVFVTQLVRLGKIPVSFQFGGRYYADGPSGAPDWGLRAAVTLVLPTGHSPASATSDGKASAK